MTEFSDKYTRIVVAVDPAVGAGRSNSETGIIVAGLGVDQFAYVMDDLSFKGSPAKWAYKVISAYWEYKADRVVAEINQGGDLVEQLLRSFDPKVSYKGVRASRGKVTRAEPIAALYEQGKVFHTRSFPRLEEQMCTYIPGKGMASPDRLDAMVWALTELMLNEGRDEPRPIAPKVWWG